MTALGLAVKAVMLDWDVKARYPDGLTGAEVLAEIRHDDPDAFPLCTELDVIDELKAIYGDRP